MNCISVIMAAGEGTRMKSDIPKTLHKACGKALAEWVVDAATEVCGSKPIVIYGSGGTAVPDYFASRCKYVMQSERLGSGHAVNMAYDLIRNSESDYTLVLAGDMPLLRAETLATLTERTERGGYSAMLLSAIFDDATGYGRIIRDGLGDVARIVEHKNATPAEREVREINASVYCFKTEELVRVLPRITKNELSGEYYLTDAIELLYSDGRKVGAMVLEDADECMGVNDRAQLAEATRILRGRVNGALMRSGVTMLDPASVYIDAGVEIGRDTVVYPGVIIEGKSKIGAGCELYQGSRIVNSAIADGVTIQNSVVLNSVVGAGTTVGPYAYLRPGTVIGKSCRIGDFVEVKNSTIADRSKVSHLSYIGDGDVGCDVNVGCGVVFGNYDGAVKSRITVGDGAFIGCNTNLVAPMKVGRGAYIAAGATVTKDIPEDALCIARAQEVIKPGRGKGRYMKK